MRMKKQVLKVKKDQRARGKGKRTEFQQRNYNRYAEERPNRVCQNDKEIRKGNSDFF